MFLFPSNLSILVCAIKFYTVTDDSTFMSDGYP
uniref:Uncharacterized protein n=1 Tax=Tetranychus urticae TaxID=32264 RepID=T1K6L1_TETUR